MLNAVRYAKAGVFIPACKSDAGKFKQSTVTLSFLHNSLTYSNFAGRSEDDKGEVIADLVPMEEKVELNTD